MSYVFRKFQSETDVKKPFDCGNADLNGFLREKGSIEPNATNYGQEHLSVTYIVEDESSGEILAYFSLLNDKIEREVADFCPRHLASAGHLHRADAVIGSFLFAGSRNVSIFALKGRWVKG